MQSKNTASLIFWLLTSCLPTLALGQASVIVSEREPITAYDPSELNPNDPRYEWEGASMLQNIRIIDGLGNAPVESQDILIADGKIVALGPTGSLEVLADTRIIEGAGLTVLPGLIDAHAHLFGGWRGGNDNGNRPVYAKWQMYTYLYAGVTHIHDIGSFGADVPADARDLVAAGVWIGPDVTISGQFIETAPVGASGESFLVQTPDPGQIGGFLDKHKETYGVEMVKCHAGTNAQILRVIVAEAHKRDMRVVCDLWHNNGNPWIAKMTHLDGFAHNIFMATEPTANDAEMLREEGTFVITTSVMLDTMTGLRTEQEGDFTTGNPLVENVHPPAWIEAAKSTGFDSSLGRYLALLQAIGGDVYSVQNMRSWGLNWTKTMVDAGMLVGLGTDAPYTGNWTGESMHREMELWVNGSGVSPLRTLQAATHDNARILKIEHRTGSIQVGLEGDLLAVEGNPAENISDTRKVRHVFNNGKLVDRESLTRQWKH